MSRGRRIARIKLVRPSPAAAKKYLLDWDNRALYHSPESFPPLDNQSLFGKSAPLILEVGCGTGEYLIDCAQTKPDVNFVGVEISRRSVYHAVNQAEKSNLENIKFIKADIKLLYPLIQPASLLSIILNFPDPNYAAGRRKHRIFSPSFLDACHRSIVPQGKISVVTDQHPYLLEMLQIAEADSRFKKPHPERYLIGPSAEHKTRFQKVWERFERNIYRFELIPS